MTTRWEVVAVELDSLPPNEKINSPDPAPEMVESVKKYGIIQNIVIPSNRKEIYAGRRRVKAARLCSLERIIALVYTPDDNSPDNEAEISAVIALIENHHRQGNARSDVIAIESLQKLGHTAESIADITGIKLQAINARLEIKRGISAALFKLFKTGKISEKVAKECILLDGSTQNAALKTYKKKKKLTSAMVKELRQADKAEAIANLPPILLEGPDLKESDTVDPKANRKAIKSVEWADVDDQTINQILTLLR